MYESGEDRQVIGTAGNSVAVEAQEIACGLDRMGDQPADDRRHPVQAIGERRHDAEVAAAAA